MLLGYEEVHWVIFPYSTDNWGNEFATEACRTFSEYPSLGSTEFQAHLKDMSNEKRVLGCLGYIGNEKLPNYVGIIVNHFKDPY